MLNKIIKIILILGFMVSCSGIQVLNQVNYYSPEFLKQIESIQLIYKDGDKQLALRKLKAIPDGNVTESEKAKKYNLIGVYYFRQNDIESAIENFQIAKQFVSKDVYLANQIRLNLAMSFFKNNQIEITYSTLKNIESSYFNKSEKKNFHRLFFLTSNQLQHHKDAVTSLVSITGELETFSQVEDYQYKEVLIDNFNKMSGSERVYILDKFKDESPVTTAYLGKMEAMNRFYQGDKEGAQDVVDWLASSFPTLAEVKSFVDDYKFRVENFSKINPGAIGVVVPLSGNYSKYGRSVVMGLNTVIGKNKNTAETTNVYLKDNQNNLLLAKKMIQELVLKHHVSVIVGGLFPSLAKEEYLEAKKYGVLYVSLAPVYLPRSEKNHLLIEIPGSVESQIASVLRPEILKTMGRKVAVLYPWTDSGKTYVNELWSLNNSGKIDLTNINHFTRGIKDYREPIKKLLGLKYPRERSEEFKVWKEIKTAEKKNVRIVNVLPPIVDFDWVFLPTRPKEAIQIFPTFSYFDAKRVKFVGGPSWINKKLFSYQQNLGRTFLIGNETKEVAAEFSKMYRAYNGVKPHLVDTLSYEGMLLIKHILEGQKFEKRADLENRVMSLKELKGLTSSWELDNGLWIKKMDLLKLTRQGLQKMAGEQL